ncbi:stage II sporulation protein M [Microlunatus ginsengisoli]|uniref:Stage II sporulation protein M n=1 Tax=Microlunatus ginsengisoli TaxID=363863 RepID=A0ABP6ZFG9_9ACTN
MDLDAYVLRHAGQWDRLAELTSKRRAMTGAEVDELVELYPRVSTQLSVVRSTAADPVLEARLSALVAAARSAITGVNVPVWQTVGRFFTTTFPAAVYRARWWWITVGIVSVALAALVAWRVITVPGLAESLLPADQAQQLVEHDFAAYYSNNPAADFALQVWLNNARVTATCLVLGVLIVPVVVVLWINMANVGAIAGFMIGAGRADVFYGLLLPHGMLELTIVFVAAGAGLRLGWSWIAPGPRTRASALAAEGRAAGAIALGLGVWLLVSGLVEGFVTPSRLPAQDRLAIGAVVWLAFLTYVFTLGRRAARAGVTGDLEADELEATVPQEAA